MDKYRHKKQGHEVAFITVNKAALIYAMVS